MKKYDTISFGAYYQEYDDKKTPIRWIILDCKAGKATLMAERLLYALSYQSSFEEYADAMGEFGFSHRAYWVESDVRKWLNSTFINKAFTQDERSLLESFENKTCNDWICDSDRVRILSSDEAKSLLTTELCIATATRFARLERGVSIDNEAVDAADGAWTLENNSGTSFDIVSKNMKIEKSNDFKNSYFIRPVISIDLNKLKTHLCECFRDVVLSDFDSISEDNELTFGRYIKSDDKETLEPLVWIVIHKDERGMLLLTKDIIDAQRISENPINDSWYDTNISHWLNGQFYNNAFNLSERKIITRRNVEVNAVDEMVSLVDNEEYKHYIDGKRMAEGEYTEYVRSKYAYELKHTIWITSTINRARHYCNEVEVNMVRNGWPNPIGATLHINTMVPIRPAIWIENPAKHIDDICAYNADRQPAENGFRNEFFVNVAGVSHSNSGSNTENRQAIIGDLVKKGLLSRGRELQLKLEPQNRFDKKAVAVIGTDGRQIGYLPTEIAHQVFDDLVSGIEYHAYVESVSGGTNSYLYGIKLRITETED